MKRRQSLWKGVYSTLFDFATQQSARAPSGLLSGLGMVEDDVETGREVFIWSESVDPKVTAAFPDILERDKLNEVRAWREGRHAMDTNTQSAGVQGVLGVKDPQEKADEFFPPGEIPNPDLSPQERALADALVNTQKAFEAGGYVNGSA
jgi:hypothetical protein